MEREIENLRLASLSSLNFELEMKEENKKLEAKIKNDW